MTTPHSQFVYVIYIRTTPEKLWEALTTPRFIRQYWFNMTLESDWRDGSPWRLLFADGRLADSGLIEEIEPPKRLVLSWQCEWQPEFKAEGRALCTFDIDSTPDGVRLAIHHRMERPESKTIAAVSTGWPRILSNLKTLLETGSLAKAA